MLTLKPLVLGHDLHYSHPEVLHEVLQRLPFILLDGEEVRVLPGPSTTLKLGNKLLVELLKEAEGVR